MQGAELIALAGALVARLAEGEELFEATCQAVRAHVPAAFWSFANTWRDVFKNGIADHKINDLAALLPWNWRLASMDRAA